jgi:hypothetical protein
MYCSTSVDDQPNPHYSTKFLSLPTAEVLGLLLKYTHVR